MAGVSWYQRAGLPHRPVVRAGDRQLSQTHDGLPFDSIPSHFSLSSNTYKIYRNRAFDRLGIEFLNQLFALMRAPVQRVDAC